MGALALPLAEWTIRIVGQGTTGIFNTTGPRSRLGMGVLLDGIKKATTSESRFTWVDADFLTAQKVRAWSDMPVWVPQRGGSAGFADISISRALAKGLTFRPIPDTAKATLEWFTKQTADRQAKLKAGLTPERETEVLAAWHAQKK